MKFLQTNRIFLTIFYILGLSPFNPRATKSKSKQNRFKFSYIAIPVQGAIGLYLAIFSIINLNIDKSIRLFGQTETLLIQIFLISSSMRSCFILKECLAHQSTIKEIIIVFENLQKYLIINLNCRLSNETFYQQFSLKFILIVGTSVQYLIIYSAQCISDNWINSVGIPIRIINLTTMFTYLQIIFYIDALCYHFDQFNVAIGHDIDYGCHYIVCKTMKSRIIRNNLLYYKTVHFRLWEEAERINKVFGCSLIAMLSEHFLAIIYAAYWLFELLDRKSAWTLLCRKFNLFCVCVYFYLSTNCLLF